MRVPCKFASSFDPSYRDTPGHHPLQVAIKAVNLAPPEAVTDPAAAVEDHAFAMGCLRQELQMLPTLCSHPYLHVCRYHGVTMLGGSVCIVMTLYPESLADYIGRQPGGWVLELTGGGVHAWHSELGICGDGSPLVSH